MQPKSSYSKNKILKVFAEGHSPDPKPHRRGCPPPQTPRRLDSLMYTAVFRMFSTTVFYLNLPVNRRSNRHITGQVTVISMGSVCECGSNVMHVVYRRSACGLAVHSLGW